MDLRNPLDKAQWRFSLALVIIGLVKGGGKNSSYYSKKASKPGSSSYLRKQKKMDVTGTYIECAWCSNSFPLYMSKGGWCVRCHTKMTGRVAPLSKTLKEGKPKPSKKDIDDAVANSSK